MRTRIHLLVLLAVVFTGTATHAQTPVAPELAAILQQKLDSCRNVYNVPGISATLLLPGDRYWNGTTGVAHIFTEEPLDTFHVFQAASTTKMFTATIVFQLIEEGLLTLDDTLGSYLPPIPNIPGNRRIRYLLNHRSGIADFVGSPGVSNAWLFTPDSIWPPLQTLTQFSNPPLFNQNASFSYSNTNYVLLGMIVEAVTGNPFWQELRDRITTPLGLEDTYFPPFDPITGVLVPGWSSFVAANTYDTDVTPYLRDCFASLVFAAGAVVIRPNDLARFTRALMTGVLLQPSSLSTMRTCTNVSFGDGSTGYGHGAGRYVYGGRTYYGHGGDISGFTQLALHSEQDGVTIALSMNRNSAPRNPITAALLAVLHQNMTVDVATHAQHAQVLELYPVPATDVVNIRCADLQPGDRIDLLDATGHVVRSERTTQVGQHRFSVQGVAAGAYIVRSAMRQGEGHRMLVVE